MFTDSEPGKRLVALTVSTLLFSFCGGAVGTSEDLTIDDFDFSGDTVPMEAAELFVEYYYGPTPDDYWIPICDIFGEEYGYMVLHYTGPEPEPPTLEKVLRTYYESTPEGMYFPDVAYEEQFEHCTIATVYSKGSMTGRFNCPVLVRFKRKADDIVTEKRDLDFESAKHVYDPRVHGKDYIGFGRMWGYIYTVDNGDIYVRVLDVIQGNDTYYTIENIPALNWEYGYTEITPKKIEEKTKGMRESWRDTIEKILSYNREEWPGYEE